MILEKRILINNINYYIGINLKYGKDKKLQKKDGSYFDSGDLSCLIDNIELNYSKDFNYDKDVLYMNDIIYIYDCIPFLSYIKTISYDSDNKIDCVDIIYKEEIDEYIKSNSIVMGYFIENNSISPMLFD